MSVFVSVFVSVSVFVFVLGGRGGRWIGGKYSTCINADSQYFPNISKENLRGGYEQTIKRRHVFTLLVGWIFNINTFFWTIGFRFPYKTNTAIN